MAEATVPVDLMTDNIIKTLQLIKQNIPLLLDMQECKLEIASLYPDKFGEAFWQKPNKEQVFEVIDVLIDEIKQNGYPAYKEFINMFKSNDVHRDAVAFIEGDASCDIDLKRNQFLGVREIIRPALTQRKIERTHIDIICDVMRPLIRDTDYETLNNCDHHRKTASSFIQTLWWSWSENDWLQSLIRGLEEADRRESGSACREVADNIRKLFDVDMSDFKKGGKRMSVDEEEGYHEGMFMEVGSSATGNLKDMPPLPTPEQAGIKFGTNNLSDPYTPSAQNPITPARQTTTSKLPKVLPGISSEDNVCVRDYQIELLEHAIYGRNTLITAPTGSGKTIVAIYLIKHHIKIRENAKVVFLANSRELVDQQYRKIMKYIPETDITIATGDRMPGDAYTEQLIRSSVVTVLTPQILENILKTNESLMESLTLMVFDECHHTIKKHAFNRVMGLYRKIKIKNGKTTLPQVVGLSALLSYGTAKTIDNAVKGILEICANMDCEIISVVKKNLKELEQHTAITTEESFIVPRSDSSEFSKIVDILLTNTEKILKHFLMRKDPKRNLCPQAYMMPKHTELKQYSSWAVHLRTQSFHLFTIAPDMYRLIDCCSRFLETFVTMMILHDDVGAKFAMTIFHDFLRTLFPNGLDNIMNQEAQGIENVNVNLTQLAKCYEQKLQAIADDPNYKNNRLERLRELILESAQNDPDMRAIVFMRTRIATQAMLEWMNETEGLRQLNPVFIVGQSQSNSGVSSSDHSSTMEKFANGTHKILIATSIVEEGIDVPACNIVFRYHYITSAVGRLQQKGRVRRTEGKSVSLLDSRSSALKDEMNLIKVAFYKAAVEIVTAMDPEYYRQQIDALQKLERKKWLIAEHRNRLMLQNTSKHVYEIKCIKCTKFLFSSLDVRTVEEVHRVIIGDDFLSRIYERPHHAPKRMSSVMFKTKKIYCATHTCSCDTSTCDCDRTCGNDLGIKLMYYQHELPCVKLENVAVTHNNRTCSHCLENPSAVESASAFPFRKWKNIPFPQLPLDIEDFKLFNDCDDDVDDGELVFRNIHPMPDENVTENLDENMDQ